MNKLLRIWSFMLLVSMMMCFIPILTAGSCGNKSNCNVDRCKSDCNFKCKDSCDSACNLGCDFNCGYPTNNICNDCNFNCDSDCASSRTIFVPRSLTTNDTLDLPLGNYFFYHHTECPEDRSFFQVQASYFHLESRKECDLAGYFLPNAGRCINIREDGNGDVGSLWIELVSPIGTQFSSRVCLSPKRKVDGGFFNFYFDFNSWLCGTWLSIAFAAANVEHTLGLCEDQLDPNALGTINNIQTATQALNNPNWTAGRLCNKTLSRTGVDDVQFKLGWNYYFCNQDHLGIYFVATAPTGCRTRNQFIFEPVVGSRHGSVGVGFNGDYTVWDCWDQAIHWMTDIKYRFVLPHCERRLFDLCNNGPWSRYLQVVTPEQRSQPTPAVNFLAQPVDVKPGSTVEFWTALHYNWCAFHLEAGYNLFWKDCEKICVQCPKSLGVGIYDMTGDLLGNPQTSSNANITQTVLNAGTNVAPSDPSFVTLSTSDFNLVSGSHPRALSHTVYGAFSYNSEVWCMPVMLGFVGSYEFARCNTAFEQWGVQVRTAISF